MGGAGERFGALCGAGLAGVRAGFGAQQRRLRLAGGFGAPLVRRGDRVVVEMGGEGWLVAIEGVAEADARGDRVMVKTAARRLSCIIGADGRVRMR